MDDAPLMMIGNGMVLAILFLNRFIAETESHQDQTELILSLGGTPKQAVHTQLMTSIKASMIPTIERQKTIGLGQLPGMMSGQIIAGASPVQAVQFQLLVVPAFNNSIHHKHHAWVLILPNDI